MKVAIIGAGNMGGAIARGLAGGSIIEATDLTVTAHTQSTLNRLHAELRDIHTTLDNYEAAEGANILILAIKPWLVQSVIEQVYPAIQHARSAGKPMLIISVAAGITFDTLHQMLGEDPMDGNAERTALVRVIPNTAIAIRQSPTLIAYNGEVSESQRSLIEAMFNELGQAIVIEERLMAAGTAITSCGIAYALEYVRAAIQGAIELGFYPHVASAMIQQTVAGAVGLLEQNGTFPETEIYKVCTPGGITIKGLNEMTRNGFANAVIAGLKKAAGQ